MKTKRRLKILICENLCNLRMKEKQNRPRLRKISERRAAWIEKLNLLFLGRGGSGLRGGRFGGALLEFIHATGGVHELLLASIKRMADVADAHDDRGFGGTRFDHVAAGAADFRVVIFRMDFRLHKKWTFKLSDKDAMTRANFPPRRLFNWLPHSNRPAVV